MEKEELETILEHLGTKAGKRNSAADVEKLKQIRAIVDALLSEEGKEPGDGDGGMMGKSAEDLYLDGWVKRNIDPNVGGGTDRDKMPAEDFAGKDRSFPIKTPGDVSDAASSIGRAGPSNYSSDQLKKNIIRIARRKGPAFVAELPESWKKELGISKSLDLSYVKSLGVFLPDWNVLAVKSIGKDEIRHYPFLWGNPQRVDVEREFFDQGTDFWDEKLGKSFTRVLTWDHMQDETMKSDPVIGRTVEFGNDEIGRWAVSQLDRSHRYRKAIDALIAEGALGSSSDTALQYAVREKSKSGATYIKQWPWFATALTTTPAEPRMFGSVDFKSLGIVLPDPEATELEQARAMAETLKAKVNYLKHYV